MRIEALILQLLLDVGVRLCLGVRCCHQPANLLIRWQLLLLGLLDRILLPATLVGFLRAWIRHGIVRIHEEAATRLQYLCILRHVVFGRGPHWCRATSLADLLVIQLLCQAGEVQIIVLGLHLNDLVQHRIHRLFVFQTACGCHVLYGRVYLGVAGWHLLGLLGAVQGFLALVAARAVVVLHLTLLAFCGWLLLLAVLRSC